VELRGLERLAFWMQNMGAALLTVKRRSLARALMLAQDSGCASGLLYLAAVRDDRREHEHRQGRVDIDPLHSRLRRLQASSWPQLHKPLCGPNRGPRLVHVPDEIHNGWKGQVRPIPENCVACLRKANQAGCLGREIAG